MSSVTIKRLVDDNLPALNAILPDIMLAKMNDRSADLEAAMQVVSYTIANIRDLQREFLS